MMEILEDERLMMEILRFACIVGIPNQQTAGIVSGRAAPGSFNIYAEYVHLLTSMRR